MVTWDRGQDSLCNVVLLGLGTIYFMEEGCYIVLCASKFSFYSSLCFAGGLYELDGRKKQPIFHGPSSQETLLKVFSPPQEMLGSLT